MQRNTILLISGIIAVLFLLNYGGALTITTGDLRVYTDGIDMEITISGLITETQSGFGVEEVWFYSVPTGEYTIIFEREGYYPLHIVKTITTGSNWAQHPGGWVLLSEPEPDTTPVDDATHPGDNMVTTSPYTWAPLGMAAAVGGVVVAVLAFKMAPFPGKFKVMAAALIAVGGFVVAHMINTGVM